MISRSAALLVSTALVSLTLVSGPAYAQTRSTAPDTGYGAFVPVQTGQKKSYANGQFEILTPAAAPAPVVMPQPVVATTAPPPIPMAPIIEPVVAAVSPPSQTVVVPSPSVKPEDAIAESPLLDDVYPEEREARTRIALNDAPLDGSTGSQASLAALALAELPPVPDDIIGNEPLSDRAITEIAVTGLERIEPTTVESYLDVRVGEILTPEKRNQSLKALYASGLFSDVAVDQTGAILTIEVKENPQINKIAFEGNKKLNDDDLQKEIQLKPRSIYTRAKALEDTDRVLNLYRRSGRYAARVEPKIIEQDQNRVDLAFEINEGPVTDIRSIRFVGNSVFSDRELRAELTSREYRWYRFLSDSDQYDPDRFNFDQELLRQFYLRKGYADFKIISALSELSPDQENFYLTFTIEEGERYKVGKVAVENNLKKFDTALLNENLTIAAGDWYNADKITKVVDGMTTTLGNEQYAFSNVRPDVKRNADTKTVDITFRIDPSPKVYIERIDVKGNVRTLDKVIRREFDLAEGDPFNKTKLAKSEKQIRDLNYFRKVDIKVREGSAPDQVIIDADVEEQSTGDIQIGAGFSSIDGPLIDFQIRERNLLGKGQDLRLGTTLAGKRTQFDIGLTDPYFLDRRLTAGIDAFRTTRDLQDESSYDQKRAGGALRLGYELSEKWRQSFKLGYEDNTIENVQDDASRFIQDQEGQRSTLSLTHRLSYDTRDSKVKPREGLIAYVDTEVAGIAQAKFVKNRVGGTVYYPFTENIIFSQQGEVGNVFGYGDEDVEINERFFIGGQTLHGFAFGGLGPRDISTDDALGGNNFYRGSTEVDFPISVDKDLPLVGHVFSDYGSVFSIDEPSDPNLVDPGTLRVAVGAGISWDSPFGPLRLDLSKAVVKEDFDEEEVVRFNFGTSF